MELTFVSEFKSIPAGGSLNLPSFVTLTGLNGSGKTQLLQSISENKIQVIVDGSQVTQVKFIGSSQLIPGNAPTAQPATSEQVYQIIAQWADALIPQGQNLTEQAQFVNRNPPGRVTDVKQKKLIPALRRVLQESFKQERKQISKSDIRLIVTNEELAEFDQEQVFHQAFSHSFLRYFQDYRANQINRLLRDHEGEKVEALSDEDFFALKGSPPWDLINEMLQKMELPYSINQPISTDNSFVAQLTNTMNGAVVGFMDLSSGEQALCSLAIALYQCEQGRVFPELLLLDEPDAHLHPKMISSMISTLKDVILPQLSCGIIITTHSPSTCAIAPSESLYLMDVASRRPSPALVDEALDALCVGIPTLSIRKEKERQVFVESDVDAELYSRLWTKLRHSKITEHGDANLHFLSSGSKTRSGNRDLAIDMCNKLRKAGSTSSFALVDHDGTDVDEPTVKVLGNGNGYAIENYLLSPILVLGLLAHRHGDDGKLPTYAEAISFGNLNQLTDEEVGALTKSFCDSLEQKCKEKRSDSPTGSAFSKINIDAVEQITITDIEGRGFALPAWYLCSNGHELERLILETYPSLRQYTGRAGGVMKAIVIHVLCSHEGMTPTAFKSSFEALLA